jgi:hypothetical protein
MVITPRWVDKNFSNFTYKTSAYWVNNQVSGLRLITSDLASKPGCSSRTDLLKEVTKKPKMDNIMAGINS